MDKNAKKILVRNIEMIAYKTATSIKISICGKAERKFVFKIICSDIASILMLKIPHKTDIKNHTRNAARIFLWILSFPILLILGHSFYHIIKILTIKLYL